MLAKRELRKYAGNIRVWTGKYRNLVNLPHWHDDCEIVYAECGGAELTVGGETLRLEEGGAAFILPREVHFIRADADGVLAFILFDEKLIDGVLAVGRVPVSPLLECDYDIPGILAKTDEELSSDSPLRALSVNNRIERLTIDIFSGESITAGGRNADAAEERFRALLADIDRNCADYALKDAAAFVALSESYFSKFFKRMTNMTFSRYLNLVKTEKAIGMIREGGRKMTDIAIDCGFGTIRNFNRVFGEVTGYSPKRLPPDYDALAIHPTYCTEDVFDPTSDDSELL